MLQFELLFRKHLWRREKARRSEIIISQVPFFIILLFIHYTAKDLVADRIPLSCMTSDVVIYISGFVQRTLKKKIKCPECLIALDTNDIWYGEIINIKNKGKLNLVITYIFNT